MGLEDALAKARDTLTSGLLTNEAGVQASIIRPILRELGWDDADPQQWRVEYQVDHGRVDEALLGGNGAPLVFIEAKKQGNLSVKAEDQLFGYAAHNGVPILVLTDGDIWDLYLSMAAGKPADRRFAHITLSEARSVGGVAEDFRRFVERGAVLSGTADDAAKARLKQVKDREVGKTGLQLAWAELLGEPDEMLRDLLIERVEEDVGSRPWTRDTEDFLRRQANPIPRDDVKRGQTNDVPERAGVTRPHSSASRRKTPAIRAVLDETFGMPPPTPSPKTRLSRSSLRGFILRGKTFAEPSGSATLARLADTLAGGDPRFLERWAAFNPGGKFTRPRAIRYDHESLQDPRKRPWYTALNDHDGWWILTNLSTNDKLGDMQRMTQVAGMSWDEDVQPLM